VTVDSLRKQAAALFPASPTPLLDAECILGFVLGVSRTETLAHGERELTPEEGAAFFAAAGKRRGGLPVAYITGIKEFFGLDFCVTPEALIPKGDTEILVERTLEALQTMGPADRGRDRPLRVWDVCTGTGCVGISLFLHSPVPLELTLTDISPGALSAARRNARRLIPPDKAGALDFAQADLLDLPRAGLFDVIVANPPYVPEAEARALLRDGRGEPVLALSGGPTGFEVTERLIAGAARRLVPGGRLLVEIDERAGSLAAETLAERGFRKIALFPDLAGKPRVASGTR
jgi:release factor glutamine methyltransferase